VDDVVSVIDAIGRLVAAIWLPVVLVFVLVRYRVPLGQFFEDIGEFSINAFGVQATVKRKAKEATEALQAAATNRAMASVPAGDNAKSLNPLAAANAISVAAVAQSITPRVLRKAGEAIVLWVDDDPGFNVHERQALEAVGVEFNLAKTTEEALVLATGRRYDAIITDMGRPDDNRAGYTLLQKLREAGDQTPVVVYSGSPKEEHRAEALEKGAFGATSRPDELFQLVLDAISASR
jgi:CheY-like chemotaxis protein